MKSEKFINILTTIILSFIPISFLISIIFTEFLIALIIFIFLLKSLKKKKLLKSKEFRLLLIIWIYLLFNWLIFDHQEYTLRSIFFIRYILLVFAIIFFLQNNKHLKVILNIWFLSIVFICFDVWFEFINGRNIINIKSQDPTRISSFFREELVVGTWIYSFVFSILFYLNEQKSKKYLFYPIVFFVIFSSIFLTGERSIFIKTTLIVIILFIFFYKKIFNSKISKIFYIIIPIALFIIYQNYNNLDVRYRGQILDPIKKEGFIKYYKSSLHGAHADAAIKIFINNPVFGVGIKNFRYECKKDKYFNPEYKKSLERCSTHPHQVVLETLSELGLVGFLIIYSIIFYIIYENFRHFIKKLNLTHGWSILFTTMSLMPLLPTGSFFSNFNSILFWINFSIMILFKTKALKKI
jgi:hypothetical protein